MQDINTRIQTYLVRADLDRYLAETPVIAKCIRGIVDVMGELPADFSLDTLYRYPVPMMSEDGSCSLIEELAPTPYDLAASVGGRNEATTRKLLLLNQVVEHVTQMTGADWLGIYQVRTNLMQHRVLVKLAYRGRPSRAEFPLTTEFAAGSTNSTVGLEGSARVIDDVAAYKAEGGGFYVCDDKVQSEACLPMFDEAGVIVGIIDAEAAPKQFFKPDRISAIVALAMVAPALLGNF
jgi:putative methionine-R-sulfoxide reductase with GAF domain